MATDYLGMLLLVVFSAVLGWRPLWLLFLNAFFVVLLEMKFSIRAKSASHFLVILYCAPNGKNDCLNTNRPVH